MAILPVTTNPGTAAARRRPRHRDGRLQHDRAIDAIHATIRQIGLPASIHGSLAGTARVFQLSLQSEPLLILAALAAVYIVLGILYESFIHPITILSTLPSAGVGALIALRLSGQEFSIIALIGVILLIGIVKKNAIMMVDFAIDATQRRYFASLDAILQACLLRFRPIMMTTCAALGGSSARPPTSSTGGVVDLPRPDPGRAGTKDRRLEPNAQGRRGRVPAVSGDRLRGPLRPVRRRRRGATDVITALALLQTTLAQATAAGVQCAQFKHAIATLIGRAPAELSINPAPRRQGRADRPADASVNPAGGHPGHPAEPAARERRAGRGARRRAGCVATVDDGPVAEVEPHRAVIQRHPTVGPGLVGLLHRHGPVGAGAGSLGQSRRPNVRI